MNGDETRGDRTLDAAVVLGLLFILLALVLIYAFVTVPPKNETVLAALGGTVVGGGVMAYVNYRFGSSKSSQAKDDTLAALATKNIKDGQ